MLSSKNCQERKIAELDPKLMQLQLVCIFIGDLVALTALSGVFLFFHSPKTCSLHAETCDSKIPLGVV